MGPSRLASLLLVCVVISQYSYDLIGDLYADPLAAAKAWHGVLRALETSILYLAIWTLCPLKPAPARLAVGAACAWGTLESAQIAACRLAYPMDRPPPDTALFTGLCDKVTGWSVYMTTVAVILVIAIFRRSNG